LLSPAVEATTSIEVLNLASSSAPVTFPAVGVEGLDGQWGSIPFNGTIVSRSSSINGQDYIVSAEYPRPTLEQIRAAEARPTGVLASTQALPSDVPPIISQLAVEITAEATNDYDALAALQRWFRSSQFTYSLEAPVQDGFDGSGAEAIAEFLDVREGYCIHFASAFAVMARTLDMPSRIVVGYLPGSAMSDIAMGDRLYSVMASQLHAWPEVFFAGIGWIPFEPTNSLGTPTSFSPAAVTTDPLGEDAEPSAGPTTAATPTPSAAPADRDDQGADAASSANPAIRALPWLGPLLGLLLIAAIPGAIREARRRALLTAARSVDAIAAWRLLQDDAIDLGLPVPPDESPRAFGARLIARHGAPPDAVDTLVEAIELSSYAPLGYRWRGTDLAAAELEVRDALRARSSRMMRLAAVVAPRSLLIRPGSVYAGDGLRAKERVGSR
jgi:transglutaminase-like putative cysteine protease